MFALFFNLYYSMFRGSWRDYSLDAISTNTKETISKLGEFLTSIFGDNQMNNLGDYLTMNNLLQMISLVLACITCVGIVVMAVKGIKRVFSIFFMGIR